MGIAAPPRRRPDRRLAAGLGVRHRRRGAPGAGPRGALSLGGPLLVHRPGLLGPRLGQRPGVDRQSGHRPLGAVGTGGGGRRRLDRTGHRRLRGGSRGRPVRLAPGRGGAGVGHGRHRPPSPRSSRRSRAGGTSRSTTSANRCRGCRPRRLGRSGAAARRPAGAQPGDRGAPATAWPTPRPRTALRIPGWLWNAASPGPADGLASSVNSAIAGGTNQLGRMLAPSGVRYVVLLTSLAPEISGEQNPEEYPVPAGLAPARSPTSSTSTPSFRARGSPSTPTPRGSRSGRSCPEGNRWPTRPTC